MDIVQELYKQNPWWEDDFNPDFIERSYYLDLLKKQLRSKNIVFLVGLRRVGKTTAFKMIIKHLLLSTASVNILYVTLDSYNLETLSIHDILEEYRKEHRLKRSEKVFLFLDEITYKADFARELKNLYDTENIKIFAAASSSSSLIDKKAFLTGRSRTIEVLPLDYNEYLLFKGITIKKSEQYLHDTYFKDYLKYGGIPEYVLTGDVSCIYSLLDDIIYKDIIAMHGIKDIRLVKNLFLLLMERSGKQVSMNKISRILNVSVDTIRRYFEYFTSSFLIYPVERCGKLNERLRSPKKIYAADIGIRNIMTGFRDKGAIFENLVYLKIKNSQPCYIYKNGAEIDFMSGSTLIEVKYGREMNDKQQELFDSIKAKEKTVIDGVKGYLSL